MSTSERERLAEEYLNKEWTHFSNCWSCGKQSFLAGYDAATKAKDEETAKLKEDFKQCCEENKSAWDLLDKRDEEIAALKAKDEELENLKKEIHALKIEMFSVAGGREILKAENARLVEIVKQVLHARQCNAPFGQMEKMPTVNQLKEALAARKEEK